MPCSSCGQRRQVVSESQAQAIVNGDKPKATYYVTEPNGTRTEFHDYLDAVTFRRAVSGVLTTTTA